MNSASAQPSSGAFWLSVLGIVGGFLLFGIIMYVVYLPSRTPSTRVPAGLTEEERQLNNLLTPEERKARLVTLRSHEAEDLHAFRWLDQENGVVLLPIDRAIELTIPQLKSEQEAH